MKFFYLKVNGNNQQIFRPAEGTWTVLPPTGSVIYAAIRHSSRAYYRIYVIKADGPVEISCRNFEKAVSEVQSFY